MGLTRTAREAGFFAARQVYTPGEDTPLTGKLQVTYHIYPPNWQSQGGDEDNLIASMKAMLDGLAKGLEINDREFKGAVCVWHEISPPGRIEMDIQEL